MYSMHKYQPGFDGFDSITNAAICCFFETQIAFNIDVSYIEY